MSMTNPPEWGHLVGKKLLYLNESRDGAFDILDISHPFINEGDKGTRILTTFRPQWGLSYHVLPVSVTLEDYMKGHQIVGVAHYAILPIKKFQETCYAHTETPLGDPIKDEGSYSTTRCPKCREEILGLKKVLGEDA